MDAASIEYAHPPLNTEITAIGGHYVLTEEQRPEIDGVAVLVFIGWGVVETSCCGTGGCRYAVVAGDIVDYRCARLAGGGWASRVAPLRAASRRRRVAAWVTRHCGVQQVVML